MNIKARMCGGGIIVRGDEKGKGRAEKGEGRKGAEAVYWWPSGTGNALSLQNH